MLNRLNTVYAVAAVKINAAKIFCFIKSRHPWPGGVTAP